MDLWQQFVRSGDAVIGMITGVDAPPPAPMKVRAVLTDFDGVIGDNDATLIRSYEQLQNQIPGLPPANVAMGYKTNPLAFFHNEMRHATGEMKSLVYTQGRQIYEATPMQLMQHACDTMNHYENSGIAWAVVSNNHNTRARWHELGLDARYPQVPVLDNAQKPDTRSMTAALQQLGQAPGRDVLMVDDDWKGLVAAAAMGLTPVYIGDRAHIVLPQVAKECKDRGIAEPEVLAVRNNAELRELVLNGIAVPTQTQLQI